MEMRRSPERYNQEGPRISIIQAIVPFYNPELAEDEQPDWHLEDAKVKCYECGGWIEEKAPLRLVLRAFTVSKKFDPTSAYHLICGHTAID